MYLHKYQNFFYRQHGAENVAKCPRHFHIGMVLFLANTSIVGIKIRLNNYASSQVFILRLYRTFIPLTLLRMNITLNHNI